jgi:hypothetical protein
MNREQVLEEVKKSIDSMRTITLIKGVVLLILAGVIGIYFALEPDRRMISGIGVLGNQIFILSLLLVILVMAGNMLWRWKGEAGERSPIYLTLRDHPENIVWVYSIDISRSGAIYRTEVWFCLTDGYAGAISIAPSNSERYKDFMNGVRSLCPRSTYGYSEEAATLFTQDPNSLLNQS